MKSILEPCHGSGIWHRDRSRQRIGNISGEIPLHHIPVPAGQLAGIPVEKIGAGACSIPDALSADRGCSDKVGASLVGNPGATLGLVIRGQAHANRINPTGIDADLRLVYQDGHDPERARRPAMLAFEMIGPNSNIFARKQAATKHSPLYRT